MLVQLQDGCFTRFRCHTGHVYSLSSLLADVTQSLEHFLWSTVRTMEESILLLRHLAQYARDQQATQDSGQAAKPSHVAHYAGRSVDLVPARTSPLARCGC